MRRRAVPLLVAATLFLAACTQSLPEPPQVTTDADTGEVVRIQSLRQLRGGNPDNWVSATDGQSTVVWTDLTIGSVDFDGDRVDLPFRLARSQEGDEGVRYEAQDVGAGDVITVGPVTMTVLAVHPALLQRNRAVDLRVAIDGDLAAPLPDPDEVTVEPAG